MSSPTPPPVFVVGLGRSGTTLTAQILDRHSRISVCGETHFLRLTAADGAEGPLTNARAEAILERLPLEWAGVEADEALAVFERTDRSLRALFDSLMRAKMLRTGKARYGEKTPLHFWYLDRLLAWYPAAKIVFVVRDPRRVHASFLRSRFAPRLGVVDRWALSRALYWSYGARQLRRITEAAPDQVLRLGFEELVSEPERSVRALCTFLDEPFEPAMLDVVADNSSFDDLGDEPGVKARALERSLELGRRDRFVLEVAAAPEMVQQGFPLTAVRPGVIRVLRAVGFYHLLRFTHRIARVMRGRP